MEVRKFRSAADRKIFQSISDDERRKLRIPLKSAKIEGLKNAGITGRWSYFLNEVLGHEEIWVAFAEDDNVDGWMDTKHNVNLIPVWPNKDFCDRSELSRKKNWRCVPVPIVDWIDVITPEIVAVGNKIAVFPIDGEEYEILDPTVFLDEWENSWKRFVKYQKKHEKDAFDKLLKDQ